MSDKNFLEDEGKKNSRFHSKFEHELYHEEDNKVEKIIRIKRTNTAGNIEKWKIFENEKVVWIVDGKKLSKKEKSFLRTIDGVNFLISECKGGIKSFNSLKISLKNKLVDN